MQMIGGPHFFVIELLQIITQGIEWLIRYLWHLETLFLKSKSVTLCFYQIQEWDLVTPQENSSPRLKPLKSWKVWRQQLIFLKVQNIINMHGQTA